jgi:hypothetical protein
MDLVAYSLPGALEPIQPHKRTRSLHSHLTILKLISSISSKMKNVFITCLLAFPLLLVSAAPLDVPKLDRRSGVHIVPLPVAHPLDTCTCRELL